MLKLLSRPLSTSTSCILNSRSLLSIPSRPSLPAFSRVPIPRFNSTKSEPSEEEISACRQWLSKFDAETIPESLSEVSFSRSSGPGGQNVNKVSSKATLRTPLDSLLPLLPSIMHAPIHQSRYYAKASNSLVIQADDSRKQADNTQLCFRKLHELVKGCGEMVVPGETSSQQKARVKNLQQRDNEVRIKMKKVHSSKKAGRRKGGGDD